MEIAAFLERYVEGYLFEDLHSMAAIKLPEGKDYGAVGYPMVMSAFSGIELLGALTCASGRRRKADAFCAFWSEFLYPNDPDRAAIGGAVYALVRHGLAHSAMAKPMVMDSKGHDGRHLRRPPPNIALWLDALTLAEELETAYFARLKPRAALDLRDVMNDRLAELRDDYRRELEKFAGVLGRLPVPGVQISASASAVTSPSAGTFLYSSHSTIVVPDTDEHS